MKIGVTGGAGYIGSHIVQDLLEVGHQVVVLDNMCLGNPDNVFADRQGYVFQQGDLNSDQDLKHFFSQGLDVVMHFAAFKAAGESMENPQKYARNNVQGTLRLVDAMLEHNCLHLVLSSTAAVYGAPRYQPIDEKHPTVPMNYYGFSKLMLEQHLDWYASLKGLRFAALRYFNAAGYDTQGRVRGLEKSPANLFPVLMEVAMGWRPEIQIFGDDYNTTDGSCIRDYIHPGDLSRAHLLAMDYIRSEDKNIIVNLGSQTGVSVLEALHMTRQITGHAIPHKMASRRAGDPPELVASSALAEKLLGWRATQSDVKTIVQSMWDVYKQSR